MSGANFSEPFIRRPVGTTLLAIGLFLVGAVAYRFLPVASMPTVDFPTINVTASRPGADPETMAATVAAPLERRLGEMAGVTELTSRSSLGSTRVTIQFDLAQAPFQGRRHRGGHGLGVGARPAGGDVDGGELDRG